MNLRSPRNAYLKKEITKTTNISAHENVQIWKTTKFHAHGFKWFHSILFIFRLFKGSAKGRRDLRRPTSTICSATITIRARSVVCRRGPIGFCGVARPSLNTKTVRNRRHATNSLTQFCHCFVWAHSRSYLVCARSGASSRMLGHGGAIFVPKIEDLATRQLLPNSCDVPELDNYVCSAVT